jgi:hypothetical protein
MGLKWVRLGLGAFLLFPTYLAQTEVAPVAVQSVAPIPPPLTTDPQFSRRRNQEEPIEVRMERERLKAWNKERFENLKKDTDKLLQLATELKASVDKANKDTLSLEVIRKTEEVEKLAKQVREKMKAQ